MYIGISLSKSEQPFNNQTDLHSNVLSDGMNESKTHTTTSTNIILKLNTSENEPTPLNYNTCTTLESTYE